MRQVFKENKRCLLPIFAGGLCWGAFYLQLMEWPHLANLFHFTPVS